MLDDLRRAAAELRGACPEVLRILLVGSLARGDWTADSDADLVVVVEGKLPSPLERSRYQVHAPVIATDTLVYSRDEFEALAADPRSRLRESLAYAVEL